MAQARVQPAGYVGDYAEDDTVYFIWHTAQADGASVTRTVDGTVAVFIDGGTTEITDGVTDTEDFDGKTGLHLCTIDLSSSASYATGKDYNVVCTGMTIDTIANVNACIGSFSIENRTATLSNQTHGGAAAVLDLEHIEIDATGVNNGVSIVTAGGHGIHIDANGAGKMGMFVQTSGAAAPAIYLYTDADGAHGIECHIDGDQSSALYGNVDGDGNVIKLSSNTGDGLEWGTVSGKLFELAEITGAADIPAAPSIEKAIALLYMWLRNATQDTATERRILNDAGTEVLDATMSDDGTTFDQGKLGDA